MTATFDQANDEILALFKLAWDATTLIALYENINTEDSPPDTQAAWARVFTRQIPGGSPSLTGALGKARYGRAGLLTVQIFVPNGEGLSLGYALGKTVADAFEGKATVSGVWFRNIRVSPVGPDGEWFQFNALVDFVYDEIK